MTERISGVPRRTLMFKPCNASVLIGLLAVFGGALPAVAEPADERTAETLVFVGELISIEPMANPCEEESKRTGTLGCIIMDELYRARDRQAGRDEGARSAPAALAHRAMIYRCARLERGSREVPWRMSWKNLTKRQSSG